LECIHKSSNLIQTPLGIETLPVGGGGIFQLAVPTSSKPH